jgi:hypothetical protein
VPATSLCKGRAKPHRRKFAECSVTAVRRERWGCQPCTPAHDAGDAEGDGGVRVNTARSPRPAPTAGMGASSTEPCVDASIRSVSGRTLLVLLICRVPSRGPWPSRVCANVPYGFRLFCVRFPRTHDSETAWVLGAAPTPRVRPPRLINPSALANRERYLVGAWFAFTPSDETEFPMFGPSNARRRLAAVAKQPSDWTIAGCPACMPRSRHEKADSGSAIGRVGTGRS